MTFVRFLPFVLFAFLMPSFSAKAQEKSDILFARTPAISPDGKTVAFSYLGDIWTVPVEGGVARPITMHQEHEINPIFSPDGEKIAFASNRHGQYDVFVVGKYGGKPNRLTYHSRDDIPTSWSADGKHILFTSTRSVDYPFRSEVFQIPADGGRVTRLTYSEGEEGVLSPDGKSFCYVNGPGKWFRKGYRGSANDEIWISDRDGQNNRRFTQFEGHDTSPSYSADGKHIFYVTDSHTTVANIVRRESDSNDKSKIKLITNHRDHGVRNCKISRDGKWLVYECGLDIFVVSSEGGESKKLAIQAFADEKTNPDRNMVFSGNASEFVVSHDEKLLGLVIHGEIFLLPRGGGKAKRITNDAANDHSLAWSPDGKRLAFLSDRSGHEDIYVIESNDAATPLLSKTKKMKLRRLTNTNNPEQSLAFSPDGKTLAFLRDGKLVTLALDGGKEKVLVEEPMVIDFAWNPDSKWLAFSRLDGSYASELYVVPADGPTKNDPIRNITKYATSNIQINWCQNGKLLAFLSERGLGAGRTVHVLALQKPTALGGKSSNDIDWEDIDQRVFRPSSKSADRVAISKDGKRLAFRSTDDKDLWIMDVTGSNLQRITNGGVEPTQLQWSNLLTNLLYYRDKSGKIYMLSIDGKSNQPLNLPFTAEMTVYRDREHLQLFEQSWRGIHDNFYDPKFHGVDWDAVKKQYKPALKHIVHREDLHDLISLMLGELNSSHVGIKSSSKSNVTETAELGVLFDESHSGSGLKVKEILARGPADRNGLALKPGDLIIRLNGVVLNTNVNVARLLAGKSDEVVALEVLSKEGNKLARRVVPLKTTSRKRITPLMYQRWVENNFATVSKLSNGKLGYIHIPSMDEKGLDLFLRSLYSDNFHKDGIVLDVRYNGGGFTHDKILNYIGGKNHTYFYQRNGGVGNVFRSSDRKFTKPVTLLINNHSFSDAEILPSAFRHLQLGKLVGTTTGGRVIGTGTIRLIDGTTFRVPRTGIVDAKGQNMENRGVIPDVEVDNTPDDIRAGKDAQLERAVATLLQDVRQWQKNSSKLDERISSRPNWSPMGPTSVESNNKK